jgi:hypothetical protein
LTSSNVRGRGFVIAGTNGRIKQGTAALRAGARGRVAYERDAGKARAAPLNHASTNSFRGNGSSLLPRLGTRGHDILIGDQSDQLRRPTKLPQRDLASRSRNGDGQKTYQIPSKDRPRPRNAGGGWRHGG